MSKGYREDKSNAIRSRIIKMRGNVVRGCARLGRGLLGRNCAFCDSASARMIVGLISCCCGGCGLKPVSTVTGAVIHMHNSCTLRLVFGSCPKRV